MMGVWQRTAVALALIVPGAAATAAEPAKPLFASSEIIHLTVNGPISAIARGAEGQNPPRDATLVLAGAGETHPIRLSARGITRRKRDICQFPPLRIEFTKPPAAASLFRGQRRLKLVTHCRGAPGFQQHLMLEYAAYQLFNVLTPASYRVRLASINYVDGEGKAPVSRLGFFIEDIDDVGRRNGLREVAAGERIQTAQLSPRETARVAMFEYMIGNLDWSTRAAPPGERCCHNSKLIGAAQNATANLIPVPYDFDFSGLVGAPYAVPPAEIPVKSVRQRRYRGYCALNAQAPGIAAEMRAQRGALLAALGQIPQLEGQPRTRAAAYLNGFFADIASDRDVAAKLLKTCIN